MLDNKDKNILVFNFKRTQGSVNLSRSPTIWSFLGRGKYNIMLLLYLRNKNIFRIFTSDGGLAFF